MILTTPYRWKQLAKALWLSGMLTALSACVGTPAIKSEPGPAAQKLKQQHLENLASIQQFSLQGRIGVQTYNKGFSGSLQWQHSSAHDDIALYSPLGSQVASIKKTADEVILEDANGRSYTAVDAETLTQTVLGWRLPLKGLADWSIGRPTDSVIEDSAWDEHGLLTTLNQDGWKIEYQNYAEQDGHMLPNKIILKSDKLNLKLLVEKWNNIEH